MLHFLSSRSSKKGLALAGSVLLLGVFGLRQSTSAVFDCETEVGAHEEAVGSTSSATDEMDAYVAAIDESADDISAVLPTIEDTIEAIGELELENTEVDDLISDIDTIHMAAIESDDAVMEGALTELDGWISLHDNYLDNLDGTLDTLSTCIDNL